MSFIELAVALFCLYASRLLVTPLWTMPHIPYISPIYKQGLHWASSPGRKVAILAHIILGIVMLCAGVHQVRMQRPNLSQRKRHRLVGRVYVLSGLGVILSLQPLISTMGMGTLGSPNLALVAMAETTSLLWLASVALALWQIRKGRKESHAAMMRVSLWMALTPLTQRLIHAVFVPAAMMVQTVLTWPGLTWSGSGELIWSPDGYGRCSQAVLAGSAWAGLLINVAFAVQNEATCCLARGARRKSDYEAHDGGYEVQELDGSGQTLLTRTPNIEPQESELLLDVSDTSPTLDVKS
jgi:uncharacterized membrane protein YqjE